MFLLIHTSLESLLKGSSRVLIKDGKINWKIINKNQFTEEDLEEEIRKQLQTDNI